MVLRLDFTSWGLIHLAIGAAVATVGLALARSQSWARVPGIVVVFVQAVSHITFLAAYPLWSVLVIGLTWWRSTR